MDIRVATYNTGFNRPTTVTTASQSGNPLATAYVQNAAQSAPVQPVNPINALSSGATQVANAGDGYTDSVRGSIINILA